MLSSKYRNKGCIGLFDKEDTNNKLSKLGNPLEILHKVFGFEMFLPVLELAVLNHNKKWIYNRGNC